MFLNINCVDLDYRLIMPNNMFVCLFSFQTKAFNRKWIIIGGTQKLGYMEYYLLILTNEYTTCKFIS